MERGLLTMSARSSRRVIEVVGPAGCGKSTLLAAIAKTTPRVRVDLSIWGQSRWRLAVAAVALAPTALASLVEGRPVRPSELLQMARVEALLRFIRRTVRATDELLVLDEGPVFALAWLIVFHERRGRWRRRWRRQSMRRWAEVLAGVIHLDAADPVIRARIRERAKSHPVKEGSDATIDLFTERFRRAYRSLLRDFEGLCGLPVAWRRTDGAPRDAVSPAPPASPVAEVAVHG